MDVGVSVILDMEKVAAGGTKGMLTGCSGSAAFSELMAGDAPIGRSPAKKTPVIAVAAIPIPISNPMPRYLISECILISIIHAGDSRFG